jgi:hypothetical protein
MEQDSDLLKTPVHSVELEPEKVRAAQFLEECFGSVSSSTTTSA